MRFTEPIWLLLLPLIWFGLWRTSKKLLGVTPARKKFIIFLRAVISLLLVFALAGIQAVQFHRRVCTIFVIDTSHSIPEPAKKRAENFLSEAIKSCHPDDIIGVIVFGRQPVVEISPTHMRTVPQFYSSPDKSATDIASALRLAMALFPDGYAKRIVVLSDGNETEGDAQTVASVAKTENITIDVVPLKTVELKKEVILTDVLTPSEAKVGQPFFVRVLAESTVDGKGVLRIDKDGVPVKEVDVQLVKGKNAFTSSLRVDSTGISRFRFTLEATPDSDPRNNIGMGLVTVKGKPKVLLVEEKPDPTRALEKLLKANDLEVTRISGWNMPSRVEEWQQYDSIIFSDFPAYDMSDQQMQTVRSSVRDTGIGFLMIGGENSFLPGGYYGTPIAEILPVDLNVRQDKNYPAATVVIIMDTSGSMAVTEGGVQKVHLAAKAAIETLKMLRPIDRFGVIVSGTGAGYFQTDWKSPIRPVKDRDRIIEQLSKVYAGGGGIYCRPSLQLAEIALVNEVTKARHVIMLADTSDCDEQEGCFEIAKRLRASGATLTTVGIGRPNDIHVPFLRRLAHIGGGNFFVTGSARDLPKLFTADVSIMTRSAIEEGAFVPIIAGDDEMLHGVNWQSVPPLLAYDLTSDRPLARTLLRTDKDDPLLATWQFGLGTSSAFTSDAKPKWARQWISWSDFSTFWANVVRYTLRRATQTQYTVMAQLKQGSVSIEMQAFTPDGQPINLLQPEIKITTPSGEGKTLLLQQEGLGRYITRFPASEIGIYLITVTEKEVGRKPKVFTSGFAVPYPLEYRFKRTNTPLLRRISEITAGKFNPSPSDVFRLPKQVGSSVSDLWKLCVWLALAFLLMDITVRRLSLGLPEVVSALAHKVSKLWEHMRIPRPAPITEARARLMAAKKKAHEKAQLVSSINPISTHSPTKHILQQPQSIQSTQSDRSVQAPQIAQLSQATKTSQPTSTPQPPLDSPSQTTSRLLELKRKKKV